MKIKLQDFLENIKDYIKPDKEVFVIGIAGGSGSGKSFLGEKICEVLDDCVLLSMDDYIDGEKVRGSDNWDVPGIWDLNLLRNHLIKLKNRKKIKKPIYDFTKHCEISFENFEPKRIIILEGNYALYESILDLIDLKIFIDIPEDIRLRRRIERDVEERGRTEEKVLKKWNDFVQPTYLKFVEPQKEKADIILILGD